MGGYFSCLELLEAVRQNGPKKITQFLKACCPCVLKIYVINDGVRGYCGHSKI